MATIRLSIAGMSCAGCVSKTEKALQAVPDVLSATVNFAEHTATVEGNVDARTLIQAITDVGYEATELADEEDLTEKDAAERAHYHALLKKSAVAAALGIPQFVFGMAGGQLCW